MKYRFAHSVSTLLFSLLFAANTFAIGSQADFFAARSYGGNNAMFYATEPGDFDGDGKVDVVTSSYDKIYVFFGDGTGEFSSTPITLFSFSGNQFYYPVTADFNEDGRADIAFLRTNPQNLQPSIAIYFGNSNRTFSAPVFSNPTPIPTTLVPFDLDADGHVDLLGEAQNSGFVIEFYKGDGTGSFAATAQIPSGDVAGISVADFDGDGLRDIAYTNSSSLNVSRNLGGNNFGAPAIVDTIDFGFATVVVADVNNDGDPDLVASQAITIQPIAAVWLGAAGTGFTHAGDIALNTFDRAYVASIADVDADGFKDAIVASPNRTIVRRGVGNGTFPQEKVYGDGGGGSLFVRDVNSDQLPDIVANQAIQFARLGSGSFTVLLNLGNGIFESAPTISLQHGTKDVAAANLNGDQLKDIVVINRGSGGGAGAIYVFFQQAAASFASNESSTFALGDAGVDAYSVTIGQFDGDNLNDIVVVGHGAFGAPENAMLLRNLGNNTFFVVLFQIGSNDIYDVVSGDFNNDGKLDLATASGFGVKVSFGVGNGTFEAPVNYLPSSSFQKLATGDVNNDQKPDLAAYTQGSSGGSISVLLNSGTGTFAASTTLASFVTDMIFSDLNGDGKLDLAASHGTGITVFSGVGNGTFGAGQNVAITPESAQGLAAADFNSDGRQDIAALGSSNTVVTLLNNGTGGFGQERLWTAGAETVAITAADLDNDQKPDFLIGFDGNYSGYLKIFFNTTTPAPPSNNAPFDFDGDGKTDIGIFRPSGGEWWINRSGNGQTFALQFGASTDKIVPADYTGDGKSDVAVFRPSSGEWYVLRSEDFSFFAVPFGTNGDIPVPARYDADGKADFAVFRPSSSTWFISQSTGAPTRIFQFGTAGDQPVVSDYDGDGKADIGIFRQAASGAEWWIDRSTAGVLAIQFGASTDKPVQGDYTGDGKSDIAIWRPLTGEWLIVRSEDFSFYGFPFGTTGDVVAPGDYDGDGKFDVTVFRPSSATWFISRTTAGTQIVQFGATGDRPLPNAFVP